MTAKVGAKGRIPGRMFPRFEARTMRAVTRPPSIPFQTTSMPITRAICGGRSPLYARGPRSASSHASLVSSYSSSALLLLRGRQETFELGEIVGALGYLQQIRAEPLRRNPRPILDHSRPDDGIGGPGEEEGEIRAGQPFGHLLHSLVAA